MKDIKWPNDIWNNEESASKKSLLPDDVIAKKALVSKFVKDNGYKEESCHYNAPKVVCNVKSGESELQVEIWIFSEYISLAIRYPFPIPTEKIAVTALLISDYNSRLDYSKIVLSVRTGELIMTNKYYLADEKLDVKILKKYFDGLINESFKVYETLGIKNMKNIKESIDRDVAYRYRTLLRKSLSLLIPSVSSTPSNTWVPSVPPIAPLGNDYIQSSDGKTSEDKTSDRKLIPFEKVKYADIKNAENGIKNSEEE